MQWLSNHIPLIVGVVIAVILIAGGYKGVLRLLGAVIVPEDSIARVNKRWVLWGANRNLPPGKIIALHGEAGWQADTLAPGLHWGLWPWQYTVEQQKFVTIPQGQIGIVEARDGTPIPAGRILAKAVECDAYQNSRDFLTKGGQRGPQGKVIPPGTYRINTALFTVIFVNAIQVPANQIGIITTAEGASLTTGEIAGREVLGHSNFQDVQAFVDAGGFKGRQEQVILAGTYFINPRFATVEFKELTEVPIATVGVVIAYVGNAGKDVSGAQFKHGNLVAKGERGVWVEPLDPGKYPINPYTHKVELVPTANVVLNWATGKTESHKLDEKLSTIKVRSSDGFSFNMDVSQIIHVPRNDAPNVIQRFGNMQNLVTQVLEPTIGNYFRNAAQKSDVIAFLLDRTTRQGEARKAIAEALQEYNVNAVDTLIGDINPPDELMKVLTDRKIAEQEKATYVVQRQAAEGRKELEQATATADTQKSVVLAQRSVEIQAFNASAAIKRAEGEAKAKTVNAEADAQVTTLNGNAEAGKVRAVGEAEASVIKQKTEAMDTDKYASVEIARALSDSGQRLVPDMVAGGAEGGGSLVTLLLMKMFKDSERNGSERRTEPRAPEVPHEPALNITTK